MSEVVRYGKWLNKGRVKGVAPPGYAEYECDQCGRTVTCKDGNWAVAQEFPYCHCGAKIYL